MSKTFTDNQELEKALILKIVYLALITASLYVLYDLLVNKKFLILQTASPIIVVYIICFLLYRFSNRLVLNKHVVAFAFLAGAFCSFIYLDGFKGVACLDICCLVMIMIIIFSGIERVVFLALSTMMILFCAYLQICHSEYIIDTFVHEYFVLDIFEVFLRLVLIGMLMWIFRQKYDQERDLALGYNLSLQEKNKEITLLNHQLEALLAKKTENIYDLHAKIDYYAFLNSHRIRGPLASILGLAYLSKHDLSMSVTFDKEILIQYIEMLESSALELDVILKEANVILAKE